MSNRLPPGEGAAGRGPQARDPCTARDEETSGRQVIFVARYVLIRLAPGLPPPPPEVQDLLDRWLTCDLVTPAEPRRILLGEYMARATGEQELGPDGVADVYELVKP